MVELRQESDLLKLDVMPQATVKDLALLRLRADLPRYAPDGPAGFGLTAGAGAASGEAEDD